MEETWLRRFALLNGIDFLAALSPGGLRALVTNAMFYKYSSSKFHQLDIADEFLALFIEYIHC
jgi:hypothetical protein